MDTRIETVVIGGGQAGLSVSYLLQLAGCEHRVLEAAAQPGSAWRSERWDSFTMNTPNWAFRLPGSEYSGADPHGFMPRAEIVAVFERYASQHNLPVQYNTRANSITHSNSGYKVETSQGDFLAQNVVMATGIFQAPKIPASSSNLGPEIVQFPSGKYRNPQTLPPGAVLVVGSAQSGCQIAEELYQSGRKVYLCVGSAGRAPRRYRGRDIFEWMDLSGIWSRPASQLPSPRARFAGNPQVSGTQGGHDINLHQFYRDGVVLLGRLQDICDGELILAPDLHENLHKADQFEQELLGKIDAFIDTNYSGTPAERIPVLNDAYQMPEISLLDIEAAGITSVIWALGFNFDYSMVKLPVCDQFGFPVSVKGETAFPGLYFTGLPWVPYQRSGLLLGVGESAAQVVELIKG